MPLNTKIKDIREGMIIVIDDDKNQVVITDAWEDQGPGLGIMLKGKTIKKVEPWEQRFLDIDEELPRITRQHMMQKFEPDTTPAHD